LNIFSDATKAFVANSTTGAAILCRAAIDAACLTFLVYVKVGGDVPGFRIDIPRGLNGIMRRAIPWSELRDALRKSEVLTEDELRIVDRIREHGNLVSHQMERYLKWIDTLRDESGGNKKARTAWILQSETWMDLKDTARVLERLCVATYRKGER
jgi:hypothetical protein